MDELVEELELYPGLNPLQAMRSGMRVARANWKRIAAYTVVVAMVLGFGGYRWVTTATPVDRSRAVELYRAERDQVAAEGNNGEARSRGPNKGAPAAATEAKDTKKKETTAGSSRVVVAAARPTSPRVEDESSTDGGAQRPAYKQPAEGVYSWSTDGYEQVSGARREFPKETQRIMTLDGPRRWTQHHYFSEEREIWTIFHWGSGGAEIEHQRNKVTFGPVTNNSTIDFAPPMLVGPKDLKVGHEWSGTWTGATHGDYSSKIFEHSTLDIGGERVEVWGMSYVINLHGEQEGRVTAEVWLAPAHGLTVKEHYVQDVESSGARYHAEWRQTLKSLQPER